MEVGHCGEENEGLGGAVESPEVSWRRWSVAVVVEVEPFSSQMILPFGVFSVDFDRWGLQRIENDEVCTLFERIWLRNEKVMRI